ncbi:MAG: aminoacyl-tRNA deacylase [Myxococcales bacterium]|nr:aminoacyl-tRNA deacylase [Myxococcales bacterium]
MAKQKFPVTAATRALKAARVAHTPHLYEYVERGGTAASSAALGVDEHRVIKTLIFQTDAGDPLVVLMHGDRAVSAKELARHLAVKTVEPCDPAVAERHSGYQVGGTSPFGLRKPLPVYVEASILDLPQVYVNGGKRGFLVQLDPQAFVQALGAQPVAVAR